MKRILGKPPEYQCVSRFPTPRNVMNRLIVGIDVSQKKLDISMTDGGRIDYIGQFANDCDGFDHLRDTLLAAQKQRGCEEILLIVEPTGGYEQMLARFSISNDWQIALVNPGQVRQWIKAIGTRGKTDRLDSQLLARYGAEVHPPLWTPPPEEVEQLSHLLSRRDDLKKMLRAEKNRQHASNTQPVCSKTARESIDKSIAFIEQQIEIVSLAILDHFQNHPPLAHKAEQLKSIPGIGEKNVIPLLVLLEQFSTLTHGSANAKQLTAYVGLDPVDHQSGSSVFRRSTISKRGNKRLRSQLYVGALGGIRGNNRLRHFYHRLVDKGKSKKLALCACARKMLVWSWAVFNTDQPFDAALGN